MENIYLSEKECYLSKGGDKKINSLSIQISSVLLSIQLLLSGCGEGNGSNKKTNTNTIDNKELLIQQNLNDELNAQIEANGKIIANLESIIIDNNNTIEKLKNDLDISNGLLILKEEKLNDINSTFNELSSNYDKLKLDYNIINEKYTLLFDSLNNADNSLEIINNELNTSNTELNNLKVLYKESLEKYLTVNNDKKILEVKLNDLNKKISIKNDLLIAKENELTILEESSDVDSKTIDLLKKEILDLKKELGEVNETKDKLIKDLKSKNKENTILIDKLKSNITDLNNEIIVLNNNLNTKDVNYDILSKNYDKLSVELVKVKGLLDVSIINISELENKLTNTKKSLEKTKKDYSSLLLEYNNLLKIIDDKNSELIKLTNVNDENKNKINELNVLNISYKKKIDELTTIIDDLNNRLLLQNTPKVNSLTFKNELYIVGVPYGLTYTCDDSDVLNYIEPNGTIGYNDMNKAITLYIGNLKIGTLNPVERINRNFHIDHKIYITNFIKDKKGNAIPTGAGAYPSSIFLEKLLLGLTNNNTPYQEGIIDDFVINYLNNHLVDLMSDLGISDNYEGSIFDLGLFDNPDNKEIINKFLGNLINELNKIYGNESLSLPNKIKAESKIIEELSK